MYECCVPHSWLRKRQQRLRGQACQGLEALEEVAPVAAAAACPSYLQWVAGELWLVGVWS